MIFWKLLKGYKLGSRLDNQYLQLLKSLLIRQLIPL
jgi:hypothetical protein